jgi:hypothetical protein
MHSVLAGSKMNQKEAHADLNRQDGTIQLLRGGSTMLGTGILAAILLETLLGGFSATGANTNSGWFALIVALMCIPFGFLLLLLGLAKWLRNRRIAHEQ